MKILKKCIAASLRQALRQRRGAASNCNKQLRLSSRGGPRRQTSETSLSQTQQFGLGNLTRTQMKLALKDLLLLLLPLLLLHNHAALAQSFSSGEHDEGLAERQPQRVQALRDEARPPPTITPRCEGGLLPPCDVVDDTPKPQARVKPRRLLQ